MRQERDESLAITGDANLGTPSPEISGEAVRESLPEVILDLEI